MRTTKRLGGIGLMLAALSACVGETGSDGNGLPWRTVADSTGDTIVVRTVGEAPDELTHTIVPALQVGALDGAEELTFGYVGDVMGLADGGLLVHDADAEIIRMFDSTGAFVRNLGGKGGGPGEYTQVNGIARHVSGDLYVWDAGGGRVNRYRSDGSYVTTWRSPFTGWFTQNQLFSDAAGRLLMWLPIIPDPNNSLERQDSYVRLDTAGSTLDTLLIPLWPDESEPLQAASPNGSSRTMTTRPWSANSVAAVHPAGGIVVGPGQDYLLYRLMTGGKPLRIEREYTPVPVTDTERSERQAQIEQSMRRLDPSWNWTGAPIPSQKPAYERLLIGEDGRIWVKVFTAGETIPEAERPTPRPNPNGPPPIVLSTREPIVYDVFEADGRFLGRVKLPPRTRVIRTRGNVAWGTVRDADDVDYAVRFRVEPALP